MSIVDTSSDAMMGDGYSMDELKQELREESLLELMPDAGSGVYLPYRGKTVDPDDYLQTVVDIHFDEVYGSPYWNEVHEELKEEYGEDFDVRDAIETYDDLADVLPEADEEDIKQRSVEEFMPRLFHREPDVEARDADSYEELTPDPAYFDMSKSSGTTGRKKIMPWREAVSSEIADWYNYNLDIRDTGDGNWLVCGPYGLYEKHMEETISDRGGIPYFTGIETRRFKTQMKRLGGLMEEPLETLKNVRELPSTLASAVKGMVRMKPTIDVLEEELRSEEIENIASAPKLVEMLHDEFDADGTESDPEDIDTILVSGAAVTEEAVEDLEELYENADVVPMYATSFTGPSFDVPEAEDIEYHPLEPFVSFEVRGEGDGLDERESVPYGERGQVMFHRVAEGFFWPNQTERESAERREGRSSFEADGIARIRPYEG